MKKVNPFNRQQKENKVQYSVFPAHKTVRTSMRIGELVPVYQLEMMQGNHVNLGVSQLTRFMTMDKPVMNDFEVSYLAAFVPDRSLDRMCGHGLRSIQFLDDAGIFSSSMLPEYFYKYALDAQVYWNPATPDSWRASHFPASVTSTQVECNNFVGSLWEHLGYALPLDLLNGKVYYADRTIASSPVWENYTKDLTYFVTLPSFAVSEDGVTYAGKYYGIGVRQFIPEFVGYQDTFIPFDVWAILNPAFGFESRSSSFHWDTLTTSTGLLAMFGVTSWTSINQVDRMEILKRKKMLDSILTGLGDVSGFTNGKCTKLIDLITAWKNAMSVFACNPGTGVGTTPSPNKRQSLWSWLAYNRLYADYFLHPNYINKDTYLEAFGAGYVAYATGVTSHTSVIRTLIHDNSPYKVIEDAMESGKCYPIMWQTDYFTSVLPNDVASNLGVTIEDGDSLPTLMEKRVFYKYKQFIARLGNDYKKNVESLYGSKVNLAQDESQLVGIRRFNVNISAIAQTAPQTSNSQETTVGDFMGYAYSNDRAGGWSWTAEEHGLFMICAMIRPKNVGYTDSIQKFTIKRLYSDFLNPFLGGVGYEDTLAYELCGSTKSNIAIGKHERYWDYMFVPNETSGAFRSTARNYALDREVTAIPIMTSTLSDISFMYITEKDDVHRIFTDTLNDPILAQIHFEGSVTRQLPATIRTDY